jgi:hypothetical protein
VEVARSDSCYNMVMPIVGGFPFSYAEVVQSKPLRHTRLWVPLAKPCATDLLLARGL